MRKGIFVTGVDTGVGKTVIAGALAAFFRKAGVNVGVMKPVQSGAIKTKTGLASPDAEYLMKSAGVADPLELVCPYILKKSLSPYHAALEEDMDIDPRKILDAFDRLSAIHDIVIVEGAGGALAPITRDVCMADLARMMNIPAVIVSHPFLGCINHTIMTARTLAMNGVEIAGIILSQYKSARYPEPDFEYMEEKSGAEIFGLAPYIGEIVNPQKASKLLSEAVGAGRLLAKLKHRGDGKKCAELDKKHVWHPFTQMKEWVENPVTVIESGAGLTLRDTDGKEYLDGFSAYWCNMHGYNEPHINRAIVNQLGKIAHSTFLGLSNIPAIKLAETLVDITPEGLDRVFYSDDGSTAVEAAVKMAVQYWRNVSPGSRRHKFLALGDAYHGDTVGAMSVGGIETYRQVFRDIMMDVEYVPPPYCYRCPIGRTYPGCSIACADIIDDKLHSGGFAAMIIEPLVQCPGGIITAPHGYLKKAAQSCEKHGVLLIADEVAVGFGRTGKMFACQHESVTPDMMTLSKSITGGVMPLAATMATNRVYEAFLGDYAEKKTFFHGHTYTGNQLGCAAALANIELIKKRDIPAVVQEKSAELMDCLAKFESLNHVGDVRMRGLIAGVELVRNGATKEPYDWSEKIGVRVCAEAKRRGLLIRPLGDVIPLFPAPIITSAQLEKMTTVLYESIITVTEK